MFYSLMFFDDDFYIPTVELVSRKIIIIQRFNFYYNELLLIYIFSLDPDTANGNTTEISITDTVKEDVNKNEKVVKNSKNTNKKSANKMANNETSLKEAESFENGKDETDKISNVEQDEELTTAEEAIPKPTPDEKPETPAAPAVFVPKYNYNPGLYFLVSSLDLT